MNIAVAGRRAALGRRSQLLNQLLVTVVIAKAANLITISNKLGNN
jgi:hypothetical protein